MLNSFFIFFFRLLGLLFRLLDLFFLFSTRFLHLFFYREGCSSSISIGWLVFSFSFSSLPSIHSNQTDSCVSLAIRVYRWHAYAFPIPFVFLDAHMYWWNFSILIILCSFLDALVYWWHAYVLGMVLSTPHILLQLALPSCSASR